MRFIQQAPKNKQQISNNIQCSKYQKLNSPKKYIAFLIHI
jgi:hypothetical protein